MEREVIIAEIRRLDPGYADEVNLDEKSNWELIYILEYIESDIEFSDIEE